MENGDCEVIEDDNNMIGACTRRLDTLLDSTLYDEYGSTLHGLLGLRKSEVNLQFMEHSINDCLSQDERISDISVECEYTDDGILADIGIVYDDNELEFSYNVDGEEELSDA
jgi:hypothetical protein